MSQYKIVITHQAREDMIFIGDYIAYTFQEPETAKKFIDDLREVILILGEFPY